MTTKFIEKYYSSATFGQTLKEQPKRILTLFFIVFWVLGLIFIMPKIFDAFQAIPLLKKAKLLLNDKENIRKNHERQSEIEYSDRNYSPIQSYNFDPEPYSEVGIVNPSPTDEGMADRAILIQEERINQFWYLLAFLFWGFCFPWILLRIYSWLTLKDKS